MQRFVIPAVRGRAFRLAVSAAIGLSAITGGGYALGANDRENSLDDARKLLLMDYIRGVVQSERAAASLPSLGVIVFDESGPLASATDGYADKEQHVPASVSSVFRAGSVTKPLTELVMMRLVDRGLLNLDVPVKQYLPDFKPVDPFGTPITLRMLAMHRAGLVREPPLGSYFSATPVDLARVVRSLNRTRLISRPGTITKYSNAGVSVIGRVLEVVTGRSYADLMRSELFNPVGMLSSSVRLLDAATPIAYSDMQSYDSPRFPAPLFEISLQPAGALNTTLTDLSLLGGVLLSGGRTAQGTQLISAALLAQMESGEGTPDANGRRFAIGFTVGDIDGHRSVSHAGAIYGFVTQFTLLPSEHLGVAAFSTLDSGSSAQRAARSALRCALALVDHQALPAIPSSRLLTKQEARPLLGLYRHDRDTVAIRWLGGETLIEAPHLSGRLRLSETGVVMQDYMLPLDLKIEANGGGLMADGIHYTRVTEPQPPSPPQSFTKLIGDFGWDHEFIRIFERNGFLFARIEWIEYDQLAAVNHDTWQFPASSPMYPGETLQFQRDRFDRAIAVSLNGIIFPRRAPVMSNVGIHLDRASFDDLREKARAADPPSKPGFAELISLKKAAPTVALDIRYATSRNLLGFPVYSKASAYLQRPAAEALARVNESLRSEGFGIVVFDAYRPWFVTKMFWDATPSAGHIFVADPAQGSRHNRGAAVDLSLVELDSKQESQMTGEYDEMSARSYPNYDGGTSKQRWRRELLRAAMEAEGFDVYPYEWWHFDYATWKDYPIMNVDFSELQ